MYTINRIFRAILPELAHPCFSLQVFLRPLGAIAAGGGAREVHKGAREEVHILFDTKWTGKLVSVFFHICRILHPNHVVLV